jgi:hypothetical protein
MGLSKQKIKICYLDSFKIIKKNIFISLTKI